MNMREKKGKDIPWVRVADRRQQLVVVRYPDRLRPTVFVPRPVDEQDELGLACSWCFLEMRDDSSSHRLDPTSWLGTYDREPDGAVLGTEPREDLPLQFSKTSGLGLLESTLENSPDTHGFPKLGPEPLVPDIVQLRVGDDHAATRQPVSSRYI